MGTVIPKNRTVSLTYVWIFTATHCVLDELLVQKHDLTSTLPCLLQVRRRTKRRRHTINEVKTNSLISTSATQPHCRQRHLAVKDRQACYHERTRWHPCRGLQMYHQIRRSSSTLQVCAPLLVGFIPKFLLFSMC